MTEIKILLEKARSTMLDFENVNKLIDSMKDDNVFSVMIKSKLKEYSNTCLSDLLIFSDLCYQLTDCFDQNEMEMILEAFTETDDEEV